MKGNEENQGESEISQLAPIRSWVRVGLMKAGLWPEFVLALGSFLFVELKILDHSMHHSGGLTSRPKDLLLALSLPLLISGAAWQEYRNLKDDLSADSNTPAVLYAVKKHILSLISLTFVVSGLLLILFDRG